MMEWALIFMGLLGLLGELIECELIEIDLKDRGNAGNWTDYWCSIVLKNFGLRYEGL